MKVKGRRGLALATAYAMAACGPIGGEGAPEKAHVDASSPGAPDASDDTRTPIGIEPPDGEPASSDASHRVAPGGYYVGAAGVFTASGAPHRFHGLNRPSLEWNAAGDHLAQQDFALIRGWKANV